MYLGLMKKGDKVIGVNSNHISIQRKNGEVDIIPLEMTDGELRIDTEHIITIGYGENVVTYETETGVQITNF